MPNMPNRLRAVAAVALPLTVPVVLRAQAPARPAVAEGGRMATVTAEDPTGATHTVSFETPGYTMVGVTDASHKTALSQWFQLTADASDSAGAARYAIVSLPDVPGFIRGSIRSSFNHPGHVRYLLDWGGGVTQSLSGGTLPMLILVSPGGAVARVFTGAPDSSRVQNLRTALGTRPTGSTSASR